MLARAAPRRLGPSQLGPSAALHAVPHALLCLVRAQATRFSSSSTTFSSAISPKHTLAVLGGGFSGLSAAYHFLRALTPHARQSTRVVLFERNDRSGGWCESVRVSRKEIGLPDGVGAGDVVLESGPRSIRPVGLLGWLTLDMAHRVGLSSSLLAVAKFAPSARNRYLFYPDKLSLMPSSLLSALLSPFTSPLIRSALPGILAEPFRRRSRLHQDPLDGGDESVDSFFRRRFGAPLADNMISAIIHGIYSGDTRELSVRAVFPGLWEAEREWGSVILAGLFGSFWRRRGWADRSEYRVKVERDEEQLKVIKEEMEQTSEGRELVQTMEGASVWGVRGGLERLTEAVERWLEREGVEVRKGTAGEVRSVSFDNGQAVIRTADSATLTATHLISTLPSLLPSPLALSPIPASTAAVVNLVFSPSAPLFPPGFGYLIPRSVAKESNPHQALGIIFDSDVMPGVDDSAQMGLEKITMISGGSYWLTSKGGPPSPLPSEEELVQQAMRTIRLHLPDQTLPEPIYARARVHKGCIPQVPPGHIARFREDADKLRRFSDESGVKVALVGGGGAVVGVNGAVKAGWEVGESFARDVNGEMGAAKTGLEIWE